MYTENVVRIDREEESLTVRKSSRDQGRDEAQASIPTRHGRSFWNDAKAHRFRFVVFVELRVFRGAEGIQSLSDHYQDEARSMSMDTGPFSTSVARF